MIWAAVWYPGVSSKGEHVTKINFRFNLNENIFELPRLG